MKDSRWQDLRQGETGLDRGPCDTLPTLAGPGLLLYLTYLAQAAGAVLLAVVFLALTRFYRRRYLLEWAWSWWASSVAFAFAGVAVYLVGYMPPLHPFRFAVSTLSIAAGYAQVLWLLAGSYDLATDRAVPARLKAWSLAGVVLLAILLEAAFSAPGSPPGGRLFFRVGLLALVAGVGFLASAVIVLRGRGDRPTLGRPLVGTAFLGWAVLYLHNFLVDLWILAGRTPPAYAAYTSFLGIFFQYLVGLGVLIWLLEGERERAARASTQLEHLAYYDPMTGLPNRDLLVERMWLGLAEAKQEGGFVSLVALDVDRFKVVNDSLGHSAGDLLLSAVALRLRSVMRPGDLLARLSGDEFALLLGGRERLDQIRHAVDRVLDLFRAPFFLADQEVFVTCSAGVSISEEAGIDPQALLKRAGIALNRAVELGGNRVEYYTSALESRAAEHLSLDTSLRHAVEQGELVLYYQPIFEAASGRLVGAEALLRWRHPERGLLLPASFLRVAETTGLIEALDLWSLLTAATQAAAWRREGAPGLRISANLSALPFQHPDLVARISQVLKDSGLPAHSLELEITETIAMQNPEASRGVLLELGRLGVRTAIDDFGTGYSSLSYLQSLPVHTVKLDHSFVRGLGRDPRARSIADAILMLAHGLDLEVVAEGVETEEQRTVLRDLGCECLQGFLLGTPVPPEVFASLYLTRGEEPAEGFEAV